jgi:hypothetical protein
MVQQDPDDFLGNVAVDEAAGICYLYSILRSARSELVSVGESRE